MANYNNLISAIQSVIVQNGNNEITGNLLQQTLVAMISSLGSGFQFIGVATPQTNPGTPDQRVFYLAGNGTYPNFGPTTIPLGSLGIFYYDTDWHYDIWAFPILDESITTVKLANGAVTGAKISDGAVTDTKLASSLLTKLFSDGYKFKGVATPQTNPGEPNQNVFYFAGPGTYPYFNNLVVYQNELGILEYGNGTWSIERIRGIGGMLQVAEVTEDGLFFVDSQLNVGAKLTVTGFESFNSINYREL